MATPVPNPADKSFFFEMAELKASVEALAEDHLLYVLNLGEYNIALGTSLDCPERITDAQRGRGYYPRVIPQKTGV